MLNGLVSNNNEAAEIAQLYQDAAFACDYRASKARLYRSAAQWWRVAAQLSIGHNRSERYESLASYCNEAAEV